MFFSTTKETNRLISKGISNIYLKVTIEKKWHTQNFDFLSLKIRLQVSFLGAPTHADFIEFSNALGLEQNCVWLFYYFNFEDNNEQK